MATGLIKACGITRIEDAVAAVESGFDAVGMVFAHSPRRVDPRAARKICSCLPPSILRVGVFLGQTRGEIKGLMEYCGLDLAQLHEAGNTALPETLGSRAVVALRPRFAEDLEELERYHSVFAVLIDAWHPELAGGTGTACDWDLAARAARSTRIILAGGLNPDNVVEAVARVRPFGVDVSSGVEAAPGIKDHALLRRFARAAREAFIGITSRRMEEVGERRGLGPREGIADGGPEADFRPAGGDKGFDVLTAEVKRKAR